MKINSLLYVSSSYVYYFKSVHLNEKTKGRADFKYKKK